MNVLLLTLPSCFLFDNQARQFGAALASFEKDYERQKAHPKRSNNEYLVGITAHNMAVVYLFAGQSEKAFELFEDAVALKRASFGNDHPQLAVSELFQLLLLVGLCRCLLLPSFHTHH